MSERMQRSKRKSDGENPQLVCPPCPPACPPPKSKIPSRKKSGELTLGKNMKNINNQQKRTDTSYTCACTQCRNQMSCCCVEDLETIEEEHDECEDQCSSDVEQTAQARNPDAPLGDSSSSKNITSERVNDLNASSSQAAEEDDPCGEFFDIMRETMEDAVKKTLDSCFNQHFTTLFEKLDALRCQMERSECILSKVYADLNDKISYYGERNAQQFQYLCVRMEHDRLFYQQQQEFFLKAVAKCPQGLELFGGQDQSQQTEQDASAAQRKCSLPKVATDERHCKGKNKDCTLPMEDTETCNPSQSCDEEDDKGSQAEQKATGRAKSSGTTDVGQRRSESVGREQSTGKPSKKK